MTELVSAELQDIMALLTGVSPREGWLGVIGCKQAVVAIAFSFLMMQFVNFIIVV